MKLGLISDVHGDIDALQMAWKLLQNLGADRVISAGDSVGYGPEPNRVVAFLAEHRVDAIRGNHDRWALERGLGEPDEFGGGLPGRATLDFLDQLPTDLLIGDGPRVAVIVHGSLSSDMEFVEPWSHPGPILRGYLDMIRADMLVVGHTHRPMSYRCDLGLVINPGSVIGVGTVDSSRSVALVDLADLSATIHDLRTGRAFEPPPWPEVAAGKRGLVSP